MFLQPAIAAPLLAMTAMLVWVSLRPGALPTIAVLACALWLVWSLRRAAEAERRVLGARLAQSEQRAQMHVRAAAASEAARSSVEADLRATGALPARAARQPGRSLGVRPCERRDAVLA